MLQITIHKGVADGLLKMADKALAKYPMDTQMGSVPLSLKGKATISILAQLQNNRYFDICAIKEAAELNDIVIPYDLKNFMSSLHCVDYNKMPTELREYLFASIIKLFEVPITHSEL